MLACWTGRCICATIRRGKRNCGTLHPIRGADPRTGDPVIVVGGWIHHHSRVVEPASLPFALAPPETASCRPAVCGATRPEAGIGLVAAIDFSTGYTLARLPDPGDWPRAHHGRQLRRLNQGGDVLG